MEDIVIACVRYDGESKLISLKDYTTSWEMVDFVVLKWESLKKYKISFKCTVGSLSNVCLESQGDMENVWVLCQTSGVKLVVVDVLFHGDGNLGQYNNEDNQMGRLNEEPSNLDCHQDVDYCVPFGDQMPLLSDGWDKLLNCGVGGVISGCAESFRLSLIKFAFKIGFRFRYTRNTRNRISVVCVDSDKAKCSWHIKAKYDQVLDAFVVYDADFEHLCFDNLARAPCHRSMCPRLMGQLLCPNAKRNSKIKASDVIDAMKLGYGVEVPYWKARRAAKYARELIFGRYDQSYDKLRIYCEAVKVTNPGSITVYEADKDSKQFCRAYISFGSCIKGFANCPPMLFVDGTFLKGRSKGTLLVAVAKDANNGLFPVSFALVSAENTDNWCWFLALIRDTVKHEQKVCWLSDRNAGLLAALPIVFDKPIHYYCLFHLLNNLRGKCSGAVNKINRKILVKMFKECAYAPNKAIFFKKLEQFKRLGGDLIEEWLGELPVQKWALSHCLKSDRFGEMTSNAAESFNAWASAARFMPVTKMFENIRAGISKWIVERRQLSNKWEGVLVPNKQELWNKMVSIVATWNVVYCPSGDYEVFSSPSVRVDVKTRTCSCYQWQYFGFPCVHAAAVLLKRQGNLSLDMVEFFLSDKYRETYSHDINPIPETVLIECQALIDDTVCGPPILGRPAGRPKIQKRIPSYGEVPNMKKRNKKAGPKDFQGV